MGMNNNARSFVTSAAVEKNRLVVLASAGTVSASSASTDRVAGVTGASSYASGKNALVEFVGVHRCTAGAAVQPGALVMPTTDGKAITATGTGNVPCGFAVEAAGADGDIIEIVLCLGLPALV